MRFVTKRTLYFLLAWLVAVGLALAMALASPNESSVMGRLPAFVSRNLMRQPVAIPSGLPSDRTLALITFNRAHREQAESWIEGLNLKNDSSIVWLRIPVFHDPGTSTGRNEAESRLLQRYPVDAERANMVPIFTDRDSFVRSAGLNGIEQAYAVVVNRQGDVLARVEGKYDAAKAEILRQTLKAQGY